MAVPAALTRPLRRIRSTWRDERARLLIALSRARRAMRLRAVAAGLGARELPVFECRRGEDVSGLFSEFAAVVGFLDHYDRHQQQYAGVRVEFSDGLYHEPSRGPDWWAYYFEPISIGGGPERRVDPHFHDHCAYLVEQSLPRTRGAGLVQQYVAVQPAVREQVDAYIAQHWTAHVVGVHYRGTDKFEDAPRMTYEHVAECVRTAAQGRADARVFVATDEAAFVDYMTREFGDRVRFRQMFRSTDGRPIDVVNADSNYQKGLDAVLDCLLLSRTHYLIRTASNLSLCSTLFNPALPGMLLNPER